MIKENIKPIIEVILLNSVKEFLKDTIGTDAESVDVLFSLFFTKNKP